MCLFRRIVEFYSSAIGSCFASTSSFINSSDGAFSSWCCSTGDSGLTVGVSSSSSILAVCDSTKNSSFGSEVARRTGVLCAVVTGERLCCAARLSSEWLGEMKTCRKTYFSICCFCNRACMAAKSIPGMDGWAADACNWLSTEGFKLLKRQNVKT